MDKEPTQTLAFRLPLSESLEVREKAKRAQLSISDYLRAVLKKAN